eukprot:g10744.t1
MQFAVFGLGDSGFRLYNAAAKKLHARLLELGAAELVGLGLGDDQSPRGMWGDLDPWLASLWSCLLKLKPLPSGTVVDDSPYLEPALFAMTPVDATASDGNPSIAAEISKGRRKFWDSVAPPRPRDSGREDAGDGAGGDAGGGAPLQASLVVNRRLTAKGHFQDTRHIELDLTGVPGGAAYGAGDIAWVHPSNNASEVETLAAAMSLDLDQVVRITPSGAGGAGDGAPVPRAVASGVDPASAAGRDGEGGPEGAVLLSASPPPPTQQQHQQQQPAAAEAAFFLPAVSTLRLLLTEVLDISGTPRGPFFGRLSLFARDEREKERLEEFASPESADLLYECVTREKLTYVEVMRAFSSCKVPPERLLELIPRLRPRGFSIASSALETPSKLHLCMAVVSFRTPYGRLRTGVCSSWLASLTPGAADVPLSIRPGTLKLPPSPHHPLVLVGPGTGVAPMRSVILERRRQREGLRQPGVDGSEDMPVVVAAAAPPDTLFFGCRSRENDFYYEEDWAALSASGDFSLQTAFSRSNPDGTGARVYVQDRIREQSAVIARLVVDEGANILVSGSAKQMPQDVREAFRDALTKHQEVGGEAGAEKLLEAMERQGRYCVETWS